MKISPLTWSLLLVMLGARPCFAGEIDVELLPRGRPFKMTFTDPREIRMALSAGSDRINAAVGNYFSIVGFRAPEEEPAPWLIHIGLEGAGFFTMRQQDSRFPLETADGLLGLYAEGSQGPWQAQLRYTHISAHLADGLSSMTPIAYSRETLSTRVAYSPGLDYMVYGGVHWIANTVPKVPTLGAQLGGNWFLSWNMPQGMQKFAPFIAADLQWRQEWTVNPSLSLQLGIALNNPPEAYRSFRFFYAYYTGADPRGQFYMSVFTSHSLGIEMQI